MGDAVSAGGGLSVWKKVIFSYQLKILSQNWDWPGMVCFNIVQIHAGHISFICIVAQILCESSCTKAYILKCMMMRIIWNEKKQ